jgi:hypothetical protein
MSCDKYLHGLVRTQSIYSGGFVESRSKLKFIFCAHMLEHAKTFEARIIESSKPDNPGQFQVAKLRVDTIFTGIVL